MVSNLPLCHSLHSEGQLTLPLQLVNYHGSLRSWDLLELTLDQGKISGPFISHPQKALLDSYNCKRVFFNLSNWHGSYFLAIVTLCHSLLFSYKQKKFLLWYECLMSNMCEIYLSWAVVLQLHPPAPQADHQVNVALQWDDDNIQVNLCLLRPIFPSRFSR